RRLGRAELLSNRWRAPAASAAVLLDVVWDLPLATAAPSLDRSGHLAAMSVGLNSSPGLQIPDRRLPPGGPTFRAGNPTEVSHRRSVYRRRLYLRCCQRMLHWRPW